MVGVVGRGWGERGDGGEQVRSEEKEDGSRLPIKVQTNKVATTI